MGKARRRKQERPLPTAAAPAKAARYRGGAFPIAALLTPLAIAVLGGVVFANSFSIPFLFDDYFAIVGNPDVKEVGPLIGYLTRPRGLPTLLSALNHRWDGFAVWGYHLVNVALHILNAILVWCIAARTLRLPALHRRYGEHATILALVTALVFLVHPLQTMVASYIVQRAESVAAVFVLFAVYAYLRGAQASDAARRALWYGAVLVAAFLGMASKQTAVVLPIQLLLYHWVLRPSAAEPVRAATAAAVPGRVPGWALGAALLLPVMFVFYLSWGVLFPAEQIGGQRSWMFIPTAGLEIDGITPWRYLITQFGVVVWYLRLFLLPTRLCFDYGWPFHDSFWSIGVAAPLALLLALVAAAVWNVRRYPLAALGIGWFLIALAPSSSILPIKDAAFEYRMYVPLFGLALLGTVGGYDVSRWAVRSGRLPAARANTIAALAAVIWIAALAAATVQRNYVLQDEVRLFADAAAKAPWNWRNHATLGNALLSLRRPDEAMAAFEKAIELNPEAGTPRVPLGELYAKRGRLADAENVLLPATDAAEESVAAAAYRQLGAVYRTMNELETAVMMYQEALRRKPDWVPTRVQLAYLLRHLGRWSGAAVQMLRAAQSSPRYAQSLARELPETCFLGALQAQENGAGRLALLLLEGARRQRTPYPAADHYLAYLSSLNGEHTRALQLMESVARQSPSAPLVAENLERARRQETLLVPQTLRQALAGGG
jgi:tetratricopeptide (TPR) repeat protein